MDFYTTVLRKSGPYWVALCLENGIAGQGNTKERAVEKLKDAIESFGNARKDDSDIFTSPISIKELHEFLTVEASEPILEPLELRAIYA
jgi:predicted RNase H-like HicB family nuclease